MKILSEIGRDNERRYVKSDVKLLDILVQMNNVNGSRCCEQH